MRRPNPRHPLGSIIVKFVLPLLLLMILVVAHGSRDRTPPVESATATLAKDSQATSILFTVPTVVVDPEADEREYAEFMIAIGDRWDDSWTKFVDRMVAYEADPSLSTDRTWLEEVEGQAVGLSEMARQIRSRQPPPQLEAEHTRIVHLTTLAGRGALLLSEALEEQNDTKWEKADRLLRRAAELRLAPAQ